jgi:hypothetical protein
LQQVLLYHCAFGEILSTALKPTQSIQTLDGLTIAITRSPSNAIHIGKALVVHADLVTGNGVMDIIDTVLLPSVQPTPHGPTPSPAQPTPSAPTPGGQSYYCQIPQYKCAPIAGGQFPSQATCLAQCRLPTPTPAPPPPTPAPNATECFIQEQQDCLQSIEGGSAACVNCITSHTADLHAHACSNQMIDSAKQLCQSPICVLAFAACYLPSSGSKADCLACANKKGTGCTEATAVLLTAICDDIVGR